MERPAMALTGTVTVLFTDLVGSTQLLSGLGDDAADGLRREYFKLLRDTISRYGGEEVKNLGDGLMVVFVSAVNAIACSIAIQQAVHERNERAGESPLGVRIGLEVGEPTREEKDYFGIPVVVAKRLCDSAHGGQIVASELVGRVVGRRGGYTFNDLGSLTLHGIPDPISAREVVWEPFEGGGPAHVAAPPERVMPLTGRPRLGRRMHESVERRRGASRGKIIVGALAVVALVAVLGAINAGRDSPGDEPGASPSRNNSSTLLSSLEWRRRNDSDFTGSGDQAINRIEAVRDQLYAVGYTRTGIDRDGEIWRSKAGLTWEKVPFSTDIFGGPGDQEVVGIKAASHGRSKVIAVGYEALGTGPHADRDAAVWTSADRQNWTRVPHDERVFGGEGQQFMNRVATGSFGTVAIGARASEDGSWNAAVWTAPQPEGGWAPVQPDDEEAFGGANNQDMRSVTSFKNKLVAVGMDRSSGDFDGAVWTSDLIVWRRVTSGAEALGGPRAQEIFTVVESRGELFAVGLETTGEGHQDAAVWRSPDARRWEKVTDDDLGGPGDQKMWGVAATAHGLVAVGREIINDDIDGAVWVSANGLEWARVQSSAFGDTASDEQIKWVVATGARLVAGGWAEAGGGLDAVIWTARLNDLEETEIP